MCESVSVETPRAFSLHDTLYSVFTTYDSTSWVLPCDLDTHLSQFRYLIRVWQEQCSVARSPSPSGDHPPCSPLIHPSSWMDDLPRWNCRAARAPPTRGHSKGVAFARAGMRGRAMRWPCAGQAQVLRQCIGHRAVHGSRRPRSCFVACYWPHPVSRPGQVQPGSLARFSFFARVPA